VKVMDFWKVAPVFLRPKGILWYAKVPLPGSARPPGQGSITFGVESTLRLLLNPNFSLHRPSLVLCAGSLKPAGAFLTLFPFKKNLNDRR
jgi:hypothetical protein